MILVGLAYSVAPSYRTAAEGSQVGQIPEAKFAVLGDAEAHTVAIPNGAIDEELNDTLRKHLDLRGAQYQWRAGWSARIEDLKLLIASWDRASIEPAEGPKRELIRQAVIPVNTHVGDIGRGMTAVLEGECEDERFPSRYGTDESEVRCGQGAPLTLNEGQELSPSNEGQEAREGRNPTGESNNWILMRQP